MQGRFVILVCAIGLSTQFSNAQGLRYVDQTSEVGLFLEPGEQNRMGGGIAVGDFNGDGWQDLFVPGDTFMPNRLFINNGDGTFVDRAESWGIADARFTLGPAVGDFDGDGDLDLFVTSGGLRSESDIPRPGQHLLYRNNGNGTFTDVAEQMGVATTSADEYNGFGAAWGDYDLDGDLDLFVAGWIVDHQPANCFFRNDGELGFTNINESVCLDDEGLPFDLNNPSTRGFSPIFADMNGDRYPELLLVSDFLTSKYLVNNRDGTFTESTVIAGAGLEGNGMGAFVADVNNDLSLDWFASSTYGTEDITTPGDGNKLYINRGNGMFDEVALDAGVDDGGWSWGVVGQDLDHDGWVDIAQTNGWSQNLEYNEEQSYLWLNNGADAGLPTFREVALDVGFEYYGLGRGMVSFDADNDGDQDLVIVSTRADLVYFENELSGPGTNWLRLLIDTQASPALAPNGYGTRIVARTGRGAQVRSITGGCHYLSQSELSMHFGLGDETSCELLIEWPNGRLSAMHKVRANQTLTIRYCVADMTGDEDGLGDGSIDIRDFRYYMMLFSLGDDLADLTGSADPGAGDFGLPDGTLDSDDFFYFLDQYVRGCG